MHIALMCMAWVVSVAQNLNFVVSRNIGVVSLAVVLVMVDSSAGKLG